MFLGGLGERLKAPAPGVRVFSHNPRISGTLHPPHCLLFAVAVTSFTPLLMFWLDLALAWGFPGSRGTELDWGELGWIGGEGGGHGNSWLGVGGLLGQLNCLAGWTDGRLRRLVCLSCLFTPSWFVMGAFFQRQGALAW